MKFPGLFMALASSILLSTASFAQESIKGNIETWCNVTCPSEISDSKQFEVQVDLKGIASATKVQANLMYIKSDGKFGGMLKVGKAFDAPAGDSTHKFSYKFAAKADAGEGIIAVFLSPDGSWDKKTKSGNGPKMKIILSPAAKVLEEKKAPESVTFKKSWLCFVSSGDDNKKYVEGDDWEVKIDYYLDPSEDWGGTQINLWCLGPWIDCPDNKYTMKRGHERYSGLGGKTKIAPGKGSYTYKMKMPKAMERNSLLLIAFFVGADGQNWPWQVRSNGPWFIRKDGFFELGSDKAGNLFKYGEAIQLKAVLKNADNSDKTMSYRIYNTKGAVEDEGKVQFKAEKSGQAVDIKPNIKSKGTFLLEAEVEGWEKRSVSFAVIPDVLKITGGRETQFGFTVHDGTREEAVKIGAMLGFTSCRYFFGWRNVQPARDVWNLEERDKNIDILNKYGIKPWLCIVQPPVWVMNAPAQDVGYFPFPFDEEGWRGAVKELSTRYKGKIIGFEWLNEIIPGKICVNPVEDYMKFCRIGNEVSKSVDPSMKSLLAGGLWPQDFRQNLFRAGIGQYIDVLPVHYSNGSAIREIKNDLAANGLENKVKIWDDETAWGISSWKKPPVEDLTDWRQSNWVLTNFTDELVNGTEKIIYFGGAPSPTGDWYYIYDDCTPRPSAAALAVYTSKMFNAKPLGAFMLGESGLFHLFERDGKALLVSSSYQDGGEDIDIICGGTSLSMTDWQGNESSVMVKERSAKLALRPLRCYVEGGELDVLKRYIVPVVHGELPAAGRGKSMVESTQISYIPQMSVLKGTPAKLYVTIMNLYDFDLKGKIEVESKTGLSKKPELVFSVEKGKEKLLDIDLAFSADVKPGAFEMELKTSFEKESLPPVSKPFKVTVLSPDSVGNLLKNSGFEEKGGTEGSAADWSGSGKNGRRVDSQKAVPGLGDFVYEFSNTNGKYETIYQGRNVEPGSSYLYSAWINAQGIPAGSNINQVLTDGAKKDLHDVRVFKSAAKTNGWQLILMKYNADPMLASSAFAPVVNGNGKVSFDNIRLSAYDGSEYAAECVKTDKAPSIDGKLDEWKKSSPIPLIGENQLVKLKPDYKWEVKNLCGAAYLNWDKDKLYLSVEARDNVHSVPSAGEKAEESDGLTIAFQPAFRTPGSDFKAFSYYVSAAVPGGGSGKYTLYRPEKQSGGFKAGHLARDSSVYQLEIKHAEGTTIYEIAIPWSETGIVPVFGTKFGMSIQLNDNDGYGREAFMEWGGGLRPAWAPDHFGVVTITE
ncbi:MAG: hypothetical protein A2X48_23160 [Lentisphaerae bacterium GWF2_49_21]|nr:MAG: hypothetical protein A2X48_23160 [Lentisphaerae bacterium GWF2_49_21]